MTGYDKNGNILSLQCYGQTSASVYALIILTGNLLNHVDDTATTSAYNNGFEFKDGVKQANEYNYDSNGNLTKDLNKGITNISYNCLNLPSVVTFSDGSTITYTYAADGTKLKTVHKTGSTTTTTDYCGNVVYENGVQKLLLTDEGYVTLSDSKYGVPQHTTNFLELLQWVDVVYIAVPNLQHVRYARVALEAGKHVIVEKPLAPTAAQTEELVNLARHKKVFLFEAITTQYLENYAKIRELLPRIGTVKLVQCNFSQYSSRYDAFCAGDVQPAFDPACAGGALMDLGVYNVSYIVGLFGEPNQAKYTANIERGIDTSGILTMDYSGFKAVSIAAKDCAAPARYIIQGTKGYILQKSTANCCGGITFHPNEGKEEHYNLNGGRPRQAAEFEAFARALESGDQELCGRMQDTTIAVSRVLTVARRNAGIRFPCDH